MRARVLRDAVWGLIPAEELVSGDFVHLQMGDLVPADLTASEGEVLIDQSALTGESVPIEVGQGKTVYAGSLVKRGEASGEVTATGRRTYFGKTAELVRSAKTASHLQSVILTDREVHGRDGHGAGGRGVPVRRDGRDASLRYASICADFLVASIPVALPATFTLATALGAVELAKRGVLVTRLSAIEEAAAMDHVVQRQDRDDHAESAIAGGACVHTRPLANRIFCASPRMRATRLARIRSISLYSLAQRPQARFRDRPSALKFVPFEPATKLAEATVIQEGKQLRALKGAPRAIATRIGHAPNIDAEVERLSAGGYRVLAVAGGPEGAIRLVGLLALQDPPRRTPRRWWQV